MGTRRHLFPEEEETTVVVGSDTYFWQVVAIQEFGILCGMIIYMAFSIGEIQWDVHDMKWRIRQLYNNPSNPSIEEIRSDTRNINRRIEQIYSNPRIDEIRADTQEMKWRLEHLYESSTVGVIRSESRDMKRTLESLDRKLESLSIKLESLDEKLKR